ncbi:uncharacterized protein [Apostichopus japonicus]|uniref:uncharacterized protein n=1 Tax=Stichopus japonicus TaxID=307972 RepID=UPI003AB2B2EF
MDSTVQINLNRCSSEQLHSFIPQLSFDIAHKIVSHRRRKGPFENIEDLLDIRGINRELYNSLKKRVFVGDITYVVDTANETTGKRKRRKGRRQTIACNHPKIISHQTVREDVLYKHPLNFQEKRTGAERYGLGLTQEFIGNDQEGLLIFLKGDLKEYSRELDGIQITVSPKQKSNISRSDYQSVKNDSSVTCDGVRPSSPMMYKLNQQSMVDSDIRNCANDEDYFTPKKTTTIIGNPRFSSSANFSILETNNHKETQTDLQPSIIHESRSQVNEGELVYQEASKDAKVRQWLRETDGSSPGHLDFAEGRDDDEDSSRVKRPKTSTPDDFRTPIANLRDYQTRPTGKVEIDYKQRKHENRPVPRCLRHGAIRRCDCDGKRHRRHRDDVYHGHPTNGEDGVLQCIIL